MAGTQSAVSAAVTDARASIAAAGGDTDGDIDVEVLLGADGSLTGIQLHYAVPASVPSAVLSADASSSAGA